MSISESERLIAFEAAMQELGNLQAVAARYRELRPDAEQLLGELMELGRVLRQAARRGLFSEDAVEHSVERVRRLRAAWLSRLEALRSSTLYRSALEAYAAGDQARLCDVLPRLIAGVERGPISPPLFRALELTGRRRQGSSPFRPPEEVASEVDAIRVEGLRSRAHGRQWWDADLPALSLATDLAAVESPAAVSVDAVPPSAPLLREGEMAVAFTPSLRVELSVVLADRCDDAWYEAAEGSYEEYRDALACELAGRGIGVRRAPAWS